MAERKVYTLKNIKDSLENCLQSDVFLYITCGMVVANPDEGIKLFNEMVDQGKVSE